jgi:lysyl-tRNA synthetase class 2
MPSTVIQRIDYQPEAGRLLVRFVSGHTYAYERVPETIYSEFRRSGSKGRFFSAKVRDRYPYRKLD